MRSQKPFFILKLVLVILFLNFILNFFFLCILYFKNLILLFNLGEKTKIRENIYLIRLKWILRNLIINKFTVPDTIRKIYKLWKVPLTFKVLTNFLMSNHLLIKILYSKVSNCRIFRFIIRKSF